MKSERFLVILKDIDWQQFKWSQCDVHHLPDEKYGHFQGSSPRFRTKAGNGFFGNLIRVKDITEKTISQLQIRMWNLSNQFSHMTCSSPFMGMNIGIVLRLEEPVMNNACQKFHDALSDFIKRYDGRQQVHVFRSDFQILPECNLTNCQSSLKWEEGAVNMSLIASAARCFTKQWMVHLCKWRLKGTVAQIFTFCHHLLKQSCIFCCVEHKISFVVECTRCSFAYNESEYWPCLSLVPIHF